MDLDFLQLDLRNGNSTVWFGVPRFMDQFGAEIPDDDVLDMARNKRVCVLIHGYNVEEPLDSCSRFILALRHAYDIFIVVRWPGSQMALAFWLAEMRANKAGNFIKDILIPVERVASHLTIMAHSLGARVALRALERGLNCSLLVLAGAAVDDESLEPGEEFGIAPVAAKKVLVAYSLQDGVLARAYWFASLDNALGRVGPQHPGRLGKNVSCVDLSASVAGHSDYSAARSFVNAWSALCD